MAFNGAAAVEVVMTEEAVMAKMTSLLLTAIFVAFRYVCNDNPGYDCTNPNQFLGCSNNVSYMIYNAQSVP
jgi:hypothetical protein